MDIQSLIIFLIIGAVAGWLAGQFMRGGGFGLLGIAAGGLLGSLITAVVGAVVLLFVVGLIKRA